MKRGSLVAAGLSIATVLAMFATRRFAQATPRRLIQIGPNTVSRAIAPGRVEVGPMIAHIGDRVALDASFTTAIDPGSFELEQHPPSTVRQSQGPTASDVNLDLVGDGVVAIEWTVNGELRSLMIDVLPPPVPGRVVESSRPQTPPLTTRYRQARPAQATQATPAQTTPQTQPTQPQTTTPAPVEEPAPAEPGTPPIVPVANAIGCTQLSSDLPAGALERAAALLRLSPTSADPRYLASRASIPVIVDLALRLEYCGSATGPWPLRDDLVRQLRDHAAFLDRNLPL